MYVRYIKYFYLLNISVYLCGKIHLRLFRTAVAPKKCACVHLWHSVHMNGHFFVSYSHSCSSCSYRVQTKHVCCNRVRATSEALKIKIKN